MLLIVINRLKTFFFSELAKITLWAFFWSIFFTNLVTNIWPALCRISSVIRQLCLNSVLTDIGDQRSIECNVIILLLNEYSELFLPLKNTVTRL